MTPWHGVSETVEEGLLVRYLHGELDGSEARELAVHLDECEACRSLADRLQARERRVRAALESADFAGPAAGEWRAVREVVREAGIRRRSRWARSLMAAGWVLAFVAAAALASAPLRAWVADTWARLVGGDAGPVATEVTPPAPDARDPGSAALAFSPEGPSLDLILESVPAEGTLTVRFTDGGSARVSVSGGDAEEITVGGQSVRIANLAGSHASWSLDLPPVVARVSVRIAGGTPVVLTREGSGGGPVVVDLARGVVVRNPPLHDDH